MSSLRHQNHRRRSHSATTLSSGARTPDNAWRVATKRAYPLSFSVKSDASTSPKCDKDLWTKSKRRRHDVPIPPFVLDDRHNTTAQPKFPFATKASDFHLFSRRERDAKPRRRSSHFTDTRSMDLDSDDERADLRNLSRLRSNAFWELHRSVTEDGEGLVRRMRDYERSRSRTDVYLKAKEAQKRGRKRSSVIGFARRAQHVRLHYDSDQREEEDEDEEDEVQIFAGELPRISLPGMLYPPKRSISLNVKDTSGRGYQISTLASSRRYSLRGSSPSFIHPGSEQFSPASAGSLPHPMSPTLSSPTPIASSGSRTEKAIAALSLAMANGAGGITDYDAVLAVPSWSSHDECQVGEMWD